MHVGCTNCPDERPTAMSDVAAALRQVDPDVRDDVQVVLVTSDPDPDTGRVLRVFLDEFDEDGLTGELDQVDAAQQAIGIDPAVKAGPIPTLPGRRNEPEREPGTAPHTHAGPLGCGVEHADAIFACAANDALPVIRTSGVTAADRAADLPRLARGDA